MLRNNINFCESTALYASKIYKRVLFDLNSYTDMIFLHTQEHVDNGVRYQTPEESLNIQSRIAQFLQDHNIPHVTATYHDADQLLLDLFFINALPAEV